MDKIMTKIHRRLARLRPETRHVIIGAGLAFDPLPERLYSTFERSDARALAQNWAVAADSLWWAVRQARQKYKEELKETRRKN